MPLSRTSVTVCDKVLLPGTCYCSHRHTDVKEMSADAGPCLLQGPYLWAYANPSVLFLQLVRYNAILKSDEGRMKSDLRLVWCLCRDIFCHLGKRAPALHFVHHRHRDLSSWFGFLFRYKQIKKSSWCNPMFNMHFCAHDTKKHHWETPQLSHSPLRADSELTWPSGKIYRDVAQWSTLCCGLPAQIQSWNNAAEHNTAWKQARLWVVVL